MTWPISLKHNSHGGELRLDKEAKRLAQAGAIELTTKLFDNFPEKPEGQPCWLDGKFIGLNELWINPRLELGFSVEGNNSDLLTKCFVEKEVHGSGSFWGKKNTEANPLVAVISKLQRGDRVRFVGKVGALSSSSRWRLFRVENVEMIETAAKKQAGDDATESPPSLNSKSSDSH